VPGAREQTIGWTDSNGNLWLFGGYGYDSTDTWGLPGDLWEFNPSTAEWTWVGGSQTLGPSNDPDLSGQPGVYGILGMASAGNIPGSRATSVAWTDAHGNFWLFGGFGITSGSLIGALDDLWEFQPSSGEWTWMGGSSTSNSAAGVYGALGVPAPANIPGARDSAAGWTDSQGNFWLFGGNGFDANDYSGWINDLWEYQPYASTMPAAAAPTFSPGSGIYTSLQAVTISDTTPGATIYYTTDETTPSADDIPYTGPITVSSSETVKAVAVANGYVNSPVTAASYTTNLLPAAAPTFTPPGGAYSAEQTVTISDATPSATIYYTTDGTTPTPGSMVYSAPITISSSQQIQAIAVAAGSSDSTVALATYTISAPSAQNLWTWMSGSNVADSIGIYGVLGVPSQSDFPASRQNPATWTDSYSHLWLFGGEGAGPNGELAELGDLWMYDPSSGEWTLEAGSSAANPAASYGTLGVASSSNTPGGRTAPVSWSDNKGNLWMFGGSGAGMLNDVWMFNPSIGQWTWMGGSGSSNQGGSYGSIAVPSATNIPGARSNAVNWTDSAGNFWLFGGYGYDSAGTLGGLNDLWEFNPATNQWTWVNGPNTANQAGVAGAFQTPAAGNVPSARNGAVSWTDAKGNFWLFGGNGAENDLWEYLPNANEWAWMSGSVSVGVLSGHQPGVYGTLQVASTTGVPGERDGATGWTDNQGNLWLFGGVGFDATNTESLLNDLWEFNTTANEWTWMGGADVAPQDCEVFYDWCGEYGAYGVLRTPALGDAPGGRYNAAGWTDSSGNFWLMGGSAVDSNGREGVINDLWEFQPIGKNQPTAATPVFSPAPGTYSSWQSVTIADSTPGATIDYIVNGNPPATVYTGPFSVSSSVTIEAIASAPGYVNSNIATAAYTENLPQAATPAFSVAPGSYANPLSVTITAATPGSVIYYSAGDAFANPFTLYTGPITISSTETVNAIAVAQGYLNSAEASGAFNIGSNPAAEWTWMGGSSTLPVKCPTSETVCGQPGWYGTLQVAAPGNQPGARQEGSAWTDTAGNLWMFGGLGYSGSSGPVLLNDLWEFNPANAQWAWMSGSDTASGTSTGVYGTLGIPSPSNIPGGRANSVSWTDSAGNLWLFGGQGIDGSGIQGYLNDVWVFNPLTKQWTWVSGSKTVPGISEGQPGVYGLLGVPAAGNSPGGRYSANAWKDLEGNFWIFGGWGVDPIGDFCNLDDLWEFNPTTELWAWMGGSNGCPNFEAGVPGLYGALGQFAPANNPGSRSSAATFTDSIGNLRFFGGIYTDLTEVNYPFNEMWEYSPASGEWAWTSAYPYGPGDYAQLGAFTTANYPGVRSDSAHWTDNQGNFWLFSGRYVDESAGVSRANDLWEFKTALNEWAWIGGANGTGNTNPGIFGTFGTPATGTIPGYRAAPMTWTDASGNLWLFGGFGVDSTGSSGYLNDMWQFGLIGSPTPPAPMIAVPVFSLTAGTYNSAQSVTLTSATAGATIYYTTDGTAPNKTSAVYAGAINISSSETVAAIAVAAGYTNSPAAVAAYTITLPAAATPTFSVPAGSYATSQIVAISDNTPNTTVYYATNGTTPTTTSAQYTSPVMVSSTETLQAIAIAAGYSQSAVASAMYTINLSALSFTVSGVDVSLSKGATSGNTSVITVQPLNGFSGNVALTATVTSSPVGAQYIPTLSFGATTPVNITGTNAGTATLTISTTATTNSALSYPRRHGVPWYAAGGAALACLLLFGVPARQRSWRTMLGMLMLLAALTASVMACGGGGNGNGGGGGGGGGGGIAGTTAGTYTITVTGTSGATTETGTVSLTVQ
jgi:N-acetylneuraminic acid mutarotase